ncbi:MAG: sterol desaturase family protein [Gammaproteobacteria bacterium]
MELNLDTGRLWVFIGGFSLFWLLETAWPARPWQGGYRGLAVRLRRLGYHGFLATLNTVLVRIVVYVPLLLWLVYVEEEGYGLARWLGLVGWTELLVSIVVLDAFDYVWHRMNHRVPLLWRLHKAHHADTGMDVTTALRFHPGELVCSAGMKALWVVVWGPSVVAWFLFEALISLCAQFHHANLDLPERVERLLAAVIVTPRFHAAHHRVERRFGNANFSTILSCWDRLAGTFSPPPAAREEAALETYGLPEGRGLAFRFSAWLDEPFRTRNLGIDRPRAG